MKAKCIFGGMAALVLIGTSAPSAAQAADPIDKDAMKTAIHKFQQENYIVGGLTLAGGLAGSLGGLFVLLHPKFKDRRRPAIPLFAFGQTQAFVGGFLLGSATSVASSLRWLDERTPGEFQQIVLPRQITVGNMLKIGLIADLALTGLSIPLLLPADYFRDWFGMGLVMVVEGVFSFVTGYAYYSAIESYKSSLERYSRFVAPPMGPQAARPILFDVKFAF